MVRKPQSSAFYWITTYVPLKDAGFNILTSPLNLGATVIKINAQTADL